MTDEELAVDAVRGEGSMEQAPIYDLGGRRLAAPRKGINSGKEFWSCSGYPQCSGTRRIT